MKPKKPKQGDSPFAKLAPLKEELARAEEARHKEQLQGKRVGILISGGNVDIARFAALLV